MPLGDFHFGSINMEKEIKKLFIHVWTYDLGHEVLLKEAKKIGNVKDQEVIDQYECFSKQANEVLNAS